MIDPQVLENGYPTFLEEEFPMDWSMTRSERYCLVQLLQKIKPKVAIEIGTYNGGSLQVISKYATKVYAIDNDSSIKDRLGSRFDNVEFLIGDSKTIVPDLIKKLQENDEMVEFVLIDGDHSYDGVRADINNILHYVPKSPVHILLHDSFNPECRRGMKSHDYNQNKHIHFVELDYIAGVCMNSGFKRQMWGGLAMIFLLPEKRKNDLKVHQSRANQYKITYLHSIHFIKKIFWFLKPLYGLVRK